MARLLADQHQVLELPPELVGRALDMGATVSTVGDVRLDMRAAVRAAFDGAADFARFERGCPSELESLDVSDSYPDGYLDAEDALDAIGDRRADAERAGATLLARVIETIRERVERDLARPPTVDGTIHLSPEVRRWHPGLIARVERWVAERDRLQAERAAAHEAAVAAYERGDGGDPGTPSWAHVDLDRRVRARRKEIAAAREDRRRAQIAACVRDWGDDSQRQRLAENMLPEEEAIALIEAHVLESLADRPLYQRIGIEDIDHDEGCYASSGEDLTCSCEVAGTLGREPYAALQEIRTAAQQACDLLGEGAALGIEPRAHTCACDHCDATLTRYGVSVRLAWGELAVAREYAL